MSWQFLSPSNPTGVTRRLELLQALTAAPLTICAWLWQPKVLSGTRTAVALNAGASLSNGWRLNVASSGAASFTIQATLQTTVTTSNQIRFNDWNFVSCVEVANNNHRVSLNGGPEASSLTTRTPTAVDRLFIGSAGSSQAYEGFVAEVAIWSTALDYLTQVLPLHLGHLDPRDVAPDFLAFHWSLRDLASLRGWRGHRLEMFAGNNGTQVLQPSPFHPAILPTRKVPIPLLAPQPRTLVPDPVLLDLLVSASRVNRQIRPTPVVLDLNVPDVGINHVVALTPAVLDLVVRRISLGGFQLPAFIVKLDPQNLSTKFDGTNAFIVFAADEADARAMAKSQLGGDANPAWDEATVTQIVPGANLEGWRLRVTIFDSTPPLEVEVTGGPAATIDDLGLAMATALNDTPLIDGASYTAASQTLVVADGLDALGDRTMSVELLPPPVGAVAIPGGVESITHQGLASDDLVAILAADNFVIPAVLARAKIS